MPAAALAILGLVVPLGMVILSGYMLLELRDDAWDRSRQTSLSLLKVIEGDIARNVEMIDLALKAATENVRAPGVAEVSPHLRQMILFDRSVSARDMGSLVVTDADGDAIADAGASPPRKANFADRDYFKAHHEAPGHGLLVSGPLVSKLTGARILAFSRRIDDAEGRFAGIAVATVRLTFFSNLFRRVGLGQDGAINLYLLNGTRVMRHPYVEADIGANIGDSENFARFRREGSGSFVASSVRDGVERDYSFTRVEGLPLVLNVAVAVDDIEARWRGKAAAIGGATVLLCAIAAGLSLISWRELRRRAAAEAELARLSMTDALTGLPNRRRFEESLDGLHQVASRSGRTLSLLIVDADHFKRINDAHGHPVGDEVLKGLARRLSACVMRPGDVVCRLGGEEFALLLPDTDADGAACVAARVHGEVAKVRVPSAGIAPGDVTVSIGLASRAHVPGGAGELYRLADAALYGAKSWGRNRTSVSPGPVPASSETSRAA